MKLRAALLIAPLVACGPESGGDPVTARVVAGDGPITVSPRVQAAYERFLGKRHPMFFALSEDGRSAFYRYCFTPGDCDEDRARADTLSGCEGFTDRVPCRMYYEVRKGVVWDGPPVVGLDTPAETDSPAQERKRKPDPAPSTTE